MAHDYKRNGTAPLFAALNAANGEVFSLRQKPATLTQSQGVRHRRQEWLTFLRLIDQTIPPERQLHVICGHYATTPEHPKVRRWLA